MHILPETKSAALHFRGIPLIILLLFILLSASALAADPVPAPGDAPKINGAEITLTGTVPTSLNVKDCSVLTADDYRAIRKLETLKNLSFAHGPDDASLKLLAGMPAVESFTTNGIGASDAGLATLGTFKSLRVLTFFHPNKTITGTGLAALSELPNLESFSVGGSNVFADAGMATVAALPHITNIRVWHTGVTMEGLKSLASLKGLKQLTLGQNLALKPPPTLNDDTIKILAGFTSLEELHLQEARLSLAALSQLKQLPHLKYITLDGVDISEADVAALKQQLPHCDIKWKAPADDGAKRRINGMFGSASASPAPSSQSRQ